MGAEGGHFPPNFRGRTGAKCPQFLSISPFPKHQGNSAPQLIFTGRNNTIAVVRIINIYLLSIYVTSENNNNENHIKSEISVRYVAMKESDGGLIPKI